VKVLPIADWKISNKIAYFLSAIVARQNRQLAIEKT